MAGATYPHGELLASMGWLAQHLSDPQLKIVDARSEGDYAEGHIPGALLLPAGAFRSTSGVPGVCSSDEFAETVGALGIAPEDLVVCYDSAGPAGARAWWAFTRFGRADVRLLNGGFQQWRDGEYPVSVEEMVAQATAYAVGDLSDDVVCSLPQAVSAVGDDAVLFWDVRSADEYSGVDPRKNPPGRAGHLPRAVHLEWTELVDPQTGLFRPAHEMRRTLAAKGITAEKEVIAY